MNRNAPDRDADKNIQEFNAMLSSLVAELKAKLEAPKSTRTKERK